MHWILGEGSDFSRQLKKERRRQVGSSWWTLDFESQEKGSGLDTADNEGRVRNSEWGKIQSHRFTLGRSRWCQ